MVLDLQELYPQGLAGKDSWHQVGWYVTSISAEKGRRPRPPAIASVCSQRKWDSLALVINGHLEANVLLPYGAISQPTKHGPVVLHGVMESNRADVSLHHF